MQNWYDRYWGLRIKDLNAHPGSREEGTHGPSHEKKVLFRRKRKAGKGDSLTTQGFLLGGGFSKRKGKTWIDRKGN